MRTSPGDFVEHCWKAGNYGFHRDLPSKNWYCPILDRVKRGDINIKHGVLTWFGCLTILKFAYMAKNSVQWEHISKSWGCPKTNRSDTRPGCRGVYRMDQSRMSSAKDWWPFPALAKFRQKNGWPSLRGVAGARGEPEPAKLAQGGAT